MVASRPSQSPNDEKSIEFHSLRKGLIARTPRVACCAGVAGLGRVLDMVAVYREGLLSLKGPLKPYLSVKNNVAQLLICATFYL